MKVESIDKLEHHPRPVLMVGMLMVAVFFSMASRVIYSPLMPSLQNELGITLSTAGMLFLLITLSYSPAILFSGFLSARIGHGNTIVVSLAALSAGMLITAFATGVTILAGGMVLIGAGAGMYPPSGVAMINTQFSPRMRSTVFSFHEVGANLGPLIAPLIVILLEPWFGWRGVLVWMAIVCSLAGLAFWRWGTAGSGVGAAPDFSTIGTILKLRNSYVGMVLLGVGLAGLHGVYAIIPAYLVSEYDMSPQYVNSLLVVSRIVCLVLLMQAGIMVKYFGKRKTIIWPLIITALLTGLMGIVDKSWVHIIVVVQPAFMAMIFPPLLSSIADIADSRYQNITYALIITVGMSFGLGVTPVLLGVFSDLGLSWAGFIALAGLMVAAVFYLITAPDFGKDY